MQYYGDVYRPPSEARSLIIQCTLGCAQNTCTFCSMYKEAGFHVRPQEAILNDLRECAAELPGLRRLFLADGDAFVLPTDRLLEILHASTRWFPSLERITAYATVNDILRKSDPELRALHDAGLDMLYVGLESGSDRILEQIHKAQTQESYVEACEKAHRAGLRLSVTLIFGLGEQAGSEEHIRESARAISRSKPEFVSFLTLHLSPGAPLYDEVQAGRFHLATDREILDEMRSFIRQVDSEGTVFRSNHASNPLSIRGTLNADRESMLEQIDRAEREGGLRPLFWRQL